jgi:integrase
MPKKRRQDKDGVYRRPDSRFWWATFVDASGTRVRRSTGQANKKDAEAILAKWAVDIHREIHWGEEPKRTFEQLMTLYLADTAASKRSAETDKLRTRALRGYFRRRTLNEIGADDIRGYIHHRRQRKVSNATINRELALLSSAINYAKRECGWNLSNPTERRKLPEPEGRVRWISQQEADALIEAASRARRAPFLADLITVALYTGCRRGELLGLEWSRVDLKAKMLHLEGRHTKSGKRRTVPLCEQACRALLSRARYRAEHCPATPWVFCYRDGHAAYDIRGAYNKACADAGIEDFTFHDLRHTCAAWLVSRGVPLTEIRDLLGHSTVMMTERYAHLAPERLRNAVNMFDTSRLRHVAENDDGRAPQKSS